MRHPFIIQDLDSFGSLIKVQPQSSASVSSVLSSSTGFTRPSRAITSASNFPLTFSMYELYRRMSGHAWISLCQAIMSYIVVVVVL